MIKALKKSLQGKTLLLLCLFVAAIASGSLLAAWSILGQEDDLHQFYPYQRMIEKYADKHSVQPELVAAVIRAESKFRPKAVSHRGAVGLMQLMPETANWIAGELGEENITAEKLKDSEFNIRYGTWYLSALLDEFEGNEVLALAAYNAGHGNVHEWMEEHGWKNDFKQIKDIPFAETRKYVEKVLNYRKQFARLYQKK